jgi:hypothetical protein
VALERARRHGEDRHFGFLGRVGIGVDPDNASFPGIKLALVSVRGVGNLALRVALGHGGHHAAAPVDLVEVAEDGGLGFGRERFDEPGASERIDGRVDAGLLGDDLLLAQGEERGFGGRDRERFVVGVGME